MDDFINSALIDLALCAKDIFNYLAVRLSKGVVLTKSNISFNFLFRSVSILISLSFNRTANSASDSFSFLVVLSLNYSSDSQS